VQTKISGPNVLSGITKYKHSTNAIKIHFSPKGKTDKSSLTPVSPEAPGKEYFPWAPPKIQDLGLEMRAYPWINVCGQTLEKAERPR
jgi:hypothetical protein